MALQFFVASVLGIAYLIVNERFKCGVSKNWLGLQVLTLIGGSIAYFGYDPRVGLIITLVSVALGTIGFLVLLLSLPGPNKFTKPLLPGMKG